MGLDEVGKFVDFMRENGVVKLRQGDLELVLGPPPVVPREKAPAAGETSPATPDAKRKKYYEKLLHRPLDEKELASLP